MSQSAEKNYFKRQNNLSLLYNETFLVNKNRTPQLQPHAFYLSAYGESQIAPGGITRIKNINNCFSQWSIELICSGKGEFSSQSTKQIHAGSLCIVPSNRSAEIKAAPDSMLYKRIIMLEKSSLISMLCTYGLNIENEVFQISDINRVNDIYDEIKSTCEKGGRYQQLDLSVLAYKLLIEIGCQLYTKSNKVSIQTILLKIIADPVGDYSRENIANMLGINIRTLTQKFVTEVGCPPIQFVIRKRMEYARDLLSSGSLSIYAVAEACGYRNPAFFSRAFKKYYGISPREFSKQNNF